MNAVIDFCRVVNFHKNVGVLKYVLVFILDGVVFPVMDV